MTRVYIDNLDAWVSKKEHDDEFRIYSVIRCISVARKPSGYVFIDFDDHRDAQDAIRDLNGKHNSNQPLIYWCSYNHYRQQNVKSIIKVIR